jgi:N-carbamoylputrescine amidase
MTTITFAATQFAVGENEADNLDKAEALIREAAASGAQVILLQELFAGHYFCKDQDPRYFDWAHPVLQHPWLHRFRDLAKALQVVLPISFFERAGQAYFNSLAMFDADGALLGVYRKTHIPDGPGYQEKFYFSPGNTGFRVWQTAYGRLGVGICWDQWFPEAARSMALMGADALLYPTAIGSEPQDPSYDSSDHWQTVMRGHAAANMMPVIASNRIGHEKGSSADITFYGRSFIANQTGQVVCEAQRDLEQILCASFDLDAIARQRHAWGLFRDRRPDAYGPLMTLDGGHADT